MKYEIKNVAAILGVTTEAVRFFEKENLIKVKRDESGRRVYDEGDVFRLLSYMKYRKMDFSLKEIATQFDDTKNWHQIREREEAARQKALEMAEHYKRVAESIDEHLKGVDMIDSLLGNYELTKSQEVLFMQTSEDGWISHDQSEQTKISKWVEHMPHVFLGVCDHGFGYFISKGNAVSKQLPMDMNVQRIPEFEAVHTIVVVDERFQYDPNSCIKQACEFLHEQCAELKFEIDGDSSAGAWGRILLVELGDGHESLNIYVELWVPVSN